MDRRRLIPIFLIVLVNFLGATLVLPTLPLYAKRQFDAPDSLIPLLNTSFFVAQFIAAPFLGRLSDKIGRMPVLILSQIGTVLSFLLMGFSQSLGMLFAARILDGITGGNVIVAQAHITDITPREHRTRALGLTFAAFGLGYTFGPALGGLISVLGDHAPFYAAAIVTSVTVLITWLMLDESLTSEERLARRQSQVSIHPREILHNMPLVLVLVIGFSAQFSMSLLQSTFPLYSEAVIFAGMEARLVGPMVGLLIGALGVGQFLTQLLIIQRVVPRFGERRTVIFGTLLRSFGLFAIILLPSPLLIGAIALMAFAIGSGIMMPSLQSLATTSVSEKICGGVLGVYQSATSMGIIFGSAISGRLFEAQPALPYLVGGTILLVTLIPAVFLLRQQELQPALAV